VLGSAGCRIAQQTVQGIGHRRGLAGAAEELRHRAGLGDEVHQCHRIGPQQPPNDHARQRRHVVADHHGRVVRCQLQTDGTGGGKRKIGSGEGRALVRRAIDHRGARLRRNARSEVRDRRQGRQHDGKARMTRPQQRHGLRETGAKTGKLGSARAGQQQQQGSAVRVNRAERCRLGTRRARLGRDGVTHEIAGDPGRLHQRRLERQQGKDVVDHARHARRPARPPRPDRGRDHVDRRQLRQGRTRKTGGTQREIWHVDGDEGIGPRLGDGRRRLVQPAAQQRIARDHLQQPHDGKIGHGEKGGQPLRLHARAAYAGKLRLRRQLAQSRDQRRPQAIARRLSGDQEQAHMGSPFRTGKATLCIGRAGP